MITPGKRRAFARLQADVLADGKVDWEETERLLDFIRPCAEAGSKPFIRLTELLNAARADGVITSSESGQIVAALRDVRAILDRQAAVEKGLMVALAVVAAVLVLINCA